MKPGRKLGQIREELSGLSSCQVSMVENCGMEEEHIYRKAEDIPEQAGYYSLLIVKEQDILFIL